MRPSFVNRVTLLRHAPAIGAIATCVLITAAVFAPTLGFGFLNWDDPWYVINNDLIKSWSPSNLFHIATDNVARNYAPLTILSLLVDHTLWGLNPAGYHVTNYLLHLLNVVLVYLLVRQVTGNSTVSFITTLVFAIHPVQVETVAWVSSRKGLLSSAFMLGSLLYWLKQERNGYDEVKGIALLIPALLCKASAVVIPPIVFTYDVLVRRKTVGESIARQVLPMFLCIQLILMTMTAQTTIVGGIRSHIGMSKLQLLWIDSLLLWKYLAMTFWPQNLCVLYDLQVTGIPITLTLCSIAWIAIAAFAWRCRHRFPLLVWAAATWFWLLFPVLNFFPITTLMNDRYLYLPIIPVVAMAAYGLIWLSSCATSHVSTRQVAAFAMAAPWMLALTMGAINYLPVFKTDSALWTYTKEKAGTLAVVQIQYALSKKNEGDLKPAIDSLNYALVHCDPDQHDIERIHRMLAEWSDQQPTISAL
jgi:hypothetical protein